MPLTFTVETIRGEARILADEVVGFRLVEVTDNSTGRRVPATEVLVRGGGQKDLVVVEPVAAVAERFAELVDPRPTPAPIPFEPATRSL